MPRATAVTSSKPNVAGRDGLHERHAGHQRENLRSQRDRRRRLHAHSSDLFFCPARISLECLVLVRVRPAASHQMGTARRMPGSFAQPGIARKSAVSGARAKLFLNVERGRALQACLRSKNCSSSVEPFNAPVDASRSIVVVTASK
jgi:hypothetical protein